MISNAVAVPECNFWQSVLSHCPTPRRLSCAPRREGCGLNTETHTFRLSRHPHLILYSLEAAFLAAGPLSFRSGEGLTGLWEWMMALARETAAARRSPR